MRHAVILAASIPWLSRIAGVVGPSALIITAMDTIDRDILRALQHDGRMRWGELAATVHLSPNAVAERVRRLQRSGVITGFSVRRDWATLGLPIHACVDVKLAPGVSAEAFESELALHESVTEAYHVTGRYDYLVVGHFADLRPSTRSSASSRATVWWQRRRPASCFARWA